MTRKNPKTVATRLSLNELAKARDGLIIKGIEEKDLQTNSQILRLCVYFMILNCENPKGEPSQESKDFIKQLWNQTKTNKNISFDELSGE